MAGLAGEAVGAPLQHAAGHEAAADAGAEGDEHGLGGAPGGADLRARPTWRVVASLSTATGRPRRAAQPGAEREVDDAGQVRPDAQHAAAVDEPGDAEADGVGVGAELGDGVDDGVDHRRPPRRHAALADARAGVVATTASSLVPPTSIPTVRTCGV